MQKRNTLNLIGSFLVFLVIVGSLSLRANENIPYYAFGKDPTVYADENNRHFLATFELLRTDGDMVLTVFSKKSDGVELNLQYNFRRRNQSIEKSSLCLSIDLDRVPPREGEDDVEEVFWGVSLEPPGDPHSKRQEPTKEVDKGTVILTRGEEFRKREKLWDSKAIWDHLVKYTKNQPNKKYRISCRVLIKVDDKFYSAHPYFVIDGRTVVAMERVRARLELQEKNKVPEDYGKEFLLQFEEKDGEVLLKGQEL